MAFWNLRHRYKRPDLYRFSFTVVLICLIATFVLVPKLNWVDIITPHARTAVTPDTWYSQADQLSDIVFVKSRFWRLIIGALVLGPQSDKNSFCSEVGHLPS